jgi:AraC-like DNA-binding protein
VARIKNFPMPIRIFNHEDPVLPMTYPGFVFRVLCAEGYEDHALLAGTGLTKEHFTDPNFRCGFAPLCLLLSNAIEQTGDPHLGVRLARKFEPTFIGLPAYAAMNAERFKDALEVLNRFLFLAFPAIEFSFPDSKAGLQPGEAAIRLRPKFPFSGIEYFAMISALVGCDGVLKAILRKVQVVLRAETTIPEPDGWGSVSNEIDFSICFEAREDRLYFAEAYLDQPLPARDPINHKRLVALCEKFAREAAGGDTAVSQVRAFLDYEPNIRAPLAETAAALGYSERGLRRQLEKSGTSYRKLVDQVRVQRARDLLCTTHPIQAIAFDLGFETPSNFARSFKRWTGTTPKAFRDSKKAQPDTGQK